MDTKVITAHVPVPLAEKVELLANRLERSKAWIMKQALAAWIDQEEEKHKLTLEALTDVDNNNIVEHQSMLDWAQSLNTDKPKSVPS